MLAGPREHRLRVRSDLGRVVRVRDGLVRGQVVRGDHLDHLVLVLGEGGPQVRRGGQVPGTAVPSGKRLVRDVAHEILEEAVLAVLGRARVGLDAEHLLPHQRCEQRLGLDVGACERGQRNACERLAEHGGVLQQPPLLGREAVEPRRDQRVQRLGDLERLDRPRQPVRRSFLDEQAAVEQHAHRLDRVQRDALGTRKDPVADVRSEARARGRSGALPSPLRERLQVQGREASLARSPGRPAFEQLRPSERDHEDR